MLLLIESEEENDLISEGLKKSVGARLGLASAIKTERAHECAILEVLKGSL